MKENIDIKEFYDTLSYGDYEEIRKWLQSLANQNSPITDWRAIDSILSAYRFTYIPSEIFMRGNLSITTGHWATIEYVSSFFEGCQYGKDYISAVRKMPRTVKGMQQRTVKTDTFVERIKTSEEICDLTCSGTAFRTNLKILPFQFNGPKIQTIKRDSTQDVLTIWIQAIGNIEQIYSDVSSVIRKNAVKCGVLNELQSNGKDLLFLER